MRVCIHRGTKEIGGTCVEIESQDKPHVLDVGLLPLTHLIQTRSHCTQFRGFDAPHPSLLGVVISHPHQDHYGLAHRLPEETQFLIGEAAERILSAAALFSPAGLKLKNVKHLADRTPIVAWGRSRLRRFSWITRPTTPTPSWLKPMASVSSIPGTSGAHGRKASVTEKPWIANPPRNVDILLMEGTCIGREDKTFRHRRRLGAASAC